MKICPLTIGSKEPYHKLKCLEHKCSWWIGGTINECAIKRLASQIGKREV